MKVTIVCVGKLKEKYWRDAIAEYSKRLSRYMKLEIIELADERCFVAPDGETEANILDLLERSIQSGHNLFAEEWEPYEYDEGLVL